MIDFIRNDMVRKKEYFKAAAKDNAKNNIRSLQQGCTATIVLLVMFLVVTPFIINGWRPSIWHVLFLPVILAFRVVLALCGKKNEPSPRLATGLCIAFGIIVFTFIVLIDVLSDRNAPSSFMALLCVIFPSCFVLKTYISYGIVCSYEVIYIIGVLLFKNDIIIKQHDVFRALCALGFSFTLWHIVMSLRIQEYDRRVRYELMSSRDPLLPDLYNKLSCQQQISKHLAQNNPKVSAALIILDLDDFKLINDTYGHHKGDLVLQCVGDAMKSVFGSMGVVARFGGDEFMVFIPRAIGESELRERCLDTGRTIARESKEKLDVQVGCSVGALLIKDQKVEGFDAIFCQADAALYEAKRNGKHNLSLNRYKEGAKVFSDV